MANDLDIPFDRITYRSGQLLTARDLRDDAQRDARLRWLHTTYLHETWGIALGLEVHKASAEGRALVVGPGYAVDDVGRDILLADGVSLTVPDVTGPQALVLVAGYLEDAAFRAQPDLAALCLGGGLDPRHERPSFSWLRPEDVRFGPQVPLVQIIVANGAVQGSLDLRVRRNARPLVRPHMGTGATEPGRTGWRPWTMGIEVEVDTSEAGFTKNPYYFPVLQADAWPAGHEAMLFLDAHSFIMHATPTSFLYRFITAASLLPGASMDAKSNQDRAAHAEAHEWSVLWLGLEPVTGCEPALMLERILAQWASFQFGKVGAWP
jgi:hypothetical protein